MIAVEIVFWAICAAFFGGSLVILAGIGSVGPCERGPYTLPPEVRPCDCPRCAGLHRGAVRIVAEVIVETDTAIKVGNGKILTWLPRSLVWTPGTQAPIVCKDGDTIEADIPAWLADEKGLR